MRIVDDRGRLFGAINLIDLGVLVFIIVLIPLAYGAYVLFRTPPPRLTAVAPSSLPFAKDVEREVQVKGEHLRPFLRARIGAIDARAFAVDSPQSGELKFADVPVGTYDVALYDESQEIARLRSALTIEPPPFQLVGSFVGLAPDDALTPGLEFGPADRPIAEVIAVDPSDGAGRRRATLRVRCRLSADRQCMVEGAAARPGSKINLPTAGTARQLTFAVDDLRVDATWIRVKVRLMGLADALAQVRPHDLDRRVGPSPAAGQTAIAGVKAGAILLSVGPLQKNQGSYVVTASQPQVGRAITAFGVLSATLPVDAQLAELEVPADSSAEGLRYGDVEIRPGKLLTFQTPAYEVQALILSLST